MRSSAVVAGYCSEPKIWEGREGLRRQKKEETLQKIPSSVASWVSFENFVILLAVVVAVGVVYAMVGQVWPVIVSMRGAAVEVGGDSGIPPQTSGNLVRAAVTGRAYGWAWRVASHVECRKVWDCVNCRPMRRDFPLRDLPLAEVRDWAHGWGAGCNCVCGDGGVCVHGRVGEAGEREQLECGGHSNSSCPLLRCHSPLRDSTIPTPQHYCSNRDVGAFGHHSIAINFDSTARARGGDVGPSPFLLPPSLRYRGETR